MLDLDELERLKNDEYRDAFLEENVRIRLALQIRLLREKAGLTQAQFAELLKTTQSHVCRLEQTDYGRMSVQTLLEIARVSKVALQVRFVPYPDFIGSVADGSESSLKVETITESLKTLERADKAMSMSKYAFPATFTTTIEPITIWAGPWQNVQRSTPIPKPRKSGKGSSTSRQLPIRIPTPTPAPFELDLSMSH